MGAIDTIADIIIESNFFEENEEGFNKIQKALKGEEIHKLTESLRNYRKEKRGEIKSKYSLQFHHFTLFIGLLDEINEQIGRNWWQSNNNLESRYRINAISKLFLKSIQTCYDLLALFESGALPTTFVLWRMIYENYIIANFLQHNDDEVSLRFNDHVEIEKFKFYPPESREEHEEYNTLKIKYGKHFSQPFGWAFSDLSDKIVSFSDIQKIVKDSEFDDYYKLSSQIIHATSLSVNRSFFSENGHGNTNMLGSFSEGLDFPYEITIQVMRKFAEMFISNYYCVDDPEGIKILSVIQVSSAVIINCLK